MHNSSSATFHSALTCLSLGTGCAPSHRNCRPSEASRTMEREPATSPSYGTLSEMQSYFCSTSRSSFAVNVLNPICNCPACFGSLQHIKSRMGAIKKKVTDEADEHLKVKHYRLSIWRQGLLCMLLPINLSLCWGKRAVIPPSQKKATQQPAEKNWIRILSLCNIPFCRNLQPEAELQIRPVF